MSDTEVVVTHHTSSADSSRGRNFSRSILFKLKLLIFQISCFLYVSLLYTPVITDEIICV